MAQSGAMFQELSSRLQNSQESPKEQPAPQKPAPGQSPQVPRKPIKNPPPDKSRSNTTGKGKKVRITVETEGDKSQTIGSTPLEPEPDSPKKKHGVWKGIKRFFGKRKDRKSTSNLDKKKSSRDEGASGQIRAKSEPDLPHALANDKDSYGKMKNSRFSWSEGLEKSDSQKSSDYDRNPSSPSDEDSSPDKFGAGLPKKIRDSFRNRFKLKRKKSDIPSDASDGSASGRTTPKSDSVASKELIDTNFFDDSFYTASLSPIVETSTTTNEKVQLSDLPAFSETSPLSTSQAAKHKMQIAPKARRKPARFRNRPDGDSSKSNEVSATLSSSATNVSEPLKEPMKVPRGSSTERLSSQEKIDRTSSSGSKSRLNQIKSKSVDSESDGSSTSLSMEHLPVKEPKRPIPVPRPRPKSLGPGLLTGESELKKEAINYEITVSKSPASKRKALPLIPQSKSASEISHSTAVDTTGSVSTRAGSASESVELVTGGVEVMTSGSEPMARTPQSTSSDFEHIEMDPSPSKEESSVTFERDTTDAGPQHHIMSHREDSSLDKISDVESHSKATPERETAPHSLTTPDVETTAKQFLIPKPSDNHVEDKEIRPETNKIQNMDSSSDQVRNNSTGEYMNFQPHLAKSSDFARKHPPPDTSLIKVSSPKLQHAAEVSAIRSSMRANSDASKKPTSPIYEQPVVQPNVTFQKRQWSSMKAKKTDPVDLRSIDIETETTSPTRSYSVSSSRYEKGMVKSHSTDRPSSSDFTNNDGASAKGIPEWIKIAQLKHKKNVGDDDSEEQNGSKQEDISAPLPPVKPSGVLTS